MIFILIMILINFNIMNLLNTFIKITLAATAILIQF